MTLENPRYDKPGKAVTKYPDCHCRDYCGQEPPPVPDYHWFHCRGLGHKSEPPQQCALCGAFIAPSPARCAKCGTEWVAPYASPERVVPTDSAEAS